MATDATGAPTSLGIPKIDPDVDAPSGLGTNAAMDSINTLLNARPSAPAGIVSGEAMVWNGASWDRSSVTRVGPSSLGSGTPDATKSLRGDGSWQATELNYTERTTSFTITATTEVGSTAVLSPGAITFDGTPVTVEFFSPLVTMPAVANAFVVVSLWEGATELGQIWVASTPTASILEVSAFGKYRFTPTAGAHTYTIKAFATSVTGTPQIIAGPGGVATAVPTFVRFAKAT